MPAKNVATVFAVAVVDRGPLNRIAADETENVVPVTPSSEP